MNKIKCIVFLLCLSIVTLWAQDNKTKTQEAPSRAIADTTRSSNPNAETAPNAGATVNGTSAQGTEDVKAAPASETADARASNTPAVPQTTTSDSGSPAVLSGGNGSDRDGTNNVQRASMNMAGSTAAGLKLDEMSSANADAEGADRQQYSQDKQTSARNADAASTPGNSGADDSGQINNNSRKENNALSDQNLSAKEKKAQGESKKRADKNSRKGKTKG